MRLGDCFRRQADQPVRARGGDGYIIAGMADDNETQTDPHHATVVRAEVRRLERRLLAIGPMPRAKLAESARAERWHEGSFEEAVSEGIRQGKLRELPLGWLEAPRS